MVDTGIPIVMGMRVLEKGRSLAMKKGRKDLLGRFDMAIDALKKYENDGHKTMDETSGRIVSAPFKGEFKLEEEAQASIDISEMAEPDNGDEEG